MCRLAAITSSKYFSPMENILALETMKEGHDGSGLGLTLKDLGGEFKDLKEYPILSGICSRKGKEVLDSYMKELGFKLIHIWTPKIKPVRGIIPRDFYFAAFYDYPDEWKDKPFEEKEDLLMNIRLTLRRMGEADESIFVFSFYPDVITIKEVGDPLQLAEFFGLDTDNLKAKIIFAQGRQNTNYQIYLYACHPFFLQGYCTMTNGENTAFVPIREFLMSRGFPGYIGYNSDSEVFCHILHYVHKKLKFPLTYYKDVITPLKWSEIETRPDREALALIKQSLRPLCIDGPNMVIGFIPDGTCFMVQDSKKLRPGVVGGVPGKYALMSELCGLDKVIPERDRSKDIFPMKYDMVIVSPGAKEVKVWNQLQA
ncbi:MAG: glutamate synthase [Thermodesulfovibrio sp.]|nr:glutamate synthase [Thermodesulfovibrio sp.]MCX7724752.1 glutamate synthase [Thermodesulfovibrio sp.]MDW7972955.1 glutamate synthase [Thermodesulfovibrio sp.]